MTAAAICEKLYYLVNPWLSLRLLRWSLLTHLAVVGKEVDDLIDILGCQHLAGVSFVSGLAAAFLAAAPFFSADGAAVAEVVARRWFARVRRVLVALAG